MKRHLSLSCSHDHRADPKNTIIQVSTEAQSFMHFDKNCVKMSQNHISNFR
eukprot:UN08745